MTNAQLMEELETTRARLGAAREQVALREAELVLKDAEIRRLADENVVLKARIDRMCRRMLADAYAARPGRFSRHGPRLLSLPKDVWINQPTPAVAVAPALHQFPT